MNNITATVYDGSKLRLVIRGVTAEGAVVVEPQVADEISRLLVPDGKVSEVVKGIVCRTQKGPDEHKAEADELVRRYGSKDQIQRQTAGLLPDEEFRELVRRHIFGPVMIDTDGHPFTKYDGLEHGFTHRDGCRVTLMREGTDRQVRFRFMSGPVKDLPVSAWDTFERIKRIVASVGSVPPFYSWNVQARYHTATCKECAETQTEYGALVSVQVAGRKLSREYQL